MKATPLLILLSLITPALHAASDDELQKLKDENAALKAQIQSMKQQQSQAPANSAGNAAAAGTSGKSGRGTAASVPAGAQTYNGVDLSESGCTTGGLGSGADIAWKEQQNWDALRRSMSMKEVEQWLGKAHYNVQSKDRLMWQYGKCGDTVQGYTVFDGDSLIYWKAPDF